MTETCPGCGAPIEPPAKACAACLPAAACEHPSDRALGIPGVRAAIGERILVGPLVAREEALYLFIESVEHRPSELQVALESAANRIGGPLGRMLLRATVAPSGKPEPPPGARPREEFSALYDRVLHDTPGLLHADLCLPIPRGSIAGATFRGDRNLELMTPAGRVELVGEFGERRAREFMAWRGYPVRQKGSGRARKIVMRVLIAASFWAFGGAGRDSDRLWIGLGLAAGAFGLWLAG